MNVSEQIDKRIKELGSWRGEMFANLRKIVLAVEPTLVEDWKWDTLVWTSNGLVCAVGAFKDNVGLNFFKGASLADPKKLFNAGLDAKTSRSVRFYAGDKIDEAALKELVRAAVSANKK